MNFKRRSFIVLSLFVSLLLSQTFIYGQEPNSTTDPNIIIKNLQKKLEQKSEMIGKIKKDLIAERKEKERLMQLCREAGINFETTDNSKNGNYQICPNPIKPNTVSDSFGTLGFTKLELSSFGWLSSVRIQQVIDSNNAIIEMPLHYDNGSYICHSPKIQTIKKSNGTRQVSTIPGDIIYHTVWLKDVQTKGFADNTKQKINYHFAVTDTKSYETAMGSQTTLYIIEPITLSSNQMKQQKLQFEELKKQYLSGKYQGEALLWPETFTNSANTNKGTTNSKRTKNIYNKR